MLGSRPQSKPYPLTSARARLNRRAQAVVAVAGLCGALFAFAFVPAPKSCQWGNDAYFWSGIACPIMLFAAPLALRTGVTILGRVALGLGFAAFGCTVASGYVRGEFPHHLHTVLSVHACSTALQSALVSLSRGHTIRSLDSQNDAERACPIRMDH